MIAPTKFELRPLPATAWEEVNALATYHAAARAMVDDTVRSTEERRDLLRDMAASAPTPDAVPMLQAMEKDLDLKAMRNWSELVTYARFSASGLADLLQRHLGDDAQAIAEVLITARILLDRVSRAGSERSLFGRDYLPGDVVRREGDAAALAAALNRIDDMVQPLAGAVTSLPDPAARRTLLNIRAVTRLWVGRCRKAAPLTADVMPMDLQIRWALLKVRFSMA